MELYDPPNGGSPIWDSYFVTSPNVDAETVELITEVNTIRNCLLHRGGIADSSVVKQAPRLGLAIGDKIELTSVMMDAYYKAVRDFAVALISAVVERLKATHTGPKGPSQP